ncbi:RNA polymerase sigma factor SigZ [Pseudochryseolinea flava]|uniref:RNA polymerase sigma factor SigZ n=1 Tax=Pseudochryseolinea flava TaxID=2059302 RepID=A0A364Y748_9BACT|nr:RNA polymerase sigma factor SigZ [Pseudochryseolinea flava]RAW02091.1 RNA polymerase sigma factor SigZ [Pseudochryseolinea flava]
MEIGIIYKQFHAELLGYVKHKIRSREDAEDILQNVFVKISSNIRTLDEDVKIKNWIFTVTRNAIIDYYRLNANKRKHATSAELTDDIADVEEPDQTKGLDQCMANMIDLLPDEYRDIIVESEIKGIKQKDLAEKYGIAYPSMRSKVQRGRERLKQLFYNCCQIETDKRGNVMDVKGKSGCGESCSPC